MLGSAEFLDRDVEPRTGDYVWLDEERRVEIREAVRTGDGRLRYLVAIEAPPPWESRRAPDPSATRREVLGVSIEVSADAAQLIVDHGGRLYLWQTGVGAGWVQDHWSFDPPPDTQFVKFPAGLIAVYLADRLEPPRTLRLGVGHVRRSKLRIEWDRETWGWRGGADSGGPG